KAKDPRCTDCGGRLLFTEPRQCPHCHRPAILSPWQRRGRWEIILVQRHSRVAGRELLYLDLPTKDERSRERSPILLAPLRHPIPPGDETNKLITAGFRTWADLYPA